MKNLDLYKIEEILSGEFPAHIEESILIDKNYFSLSSVHSDFIQKHIDKNTRLISNTFALYFDTIEELIQKNKKEEAFSADYEFSDLFGDVVDIEQEISTTSNIIDSFLKELRENIEKNNEIHTKENLIAVIEPCLEINTNINEHLLEILEQLSNTDNKLTEIDNIQSQIENFEYEIRELEKEKSILYSEENEEEIEENIDEIEEKIENIKTNKKNSYDEIDNILEQHKESKYSFFIQKYLNENYDNSEVFQKASDISDYYSIYQNKIEDEYINLLDNVNAEIYDLKDSNNHKNICSIYQEYLNNNENDSIEEQFINDNLYLKLELKGIDNIQQIHIFNDLSSTITYQNGETKNNHTLNSTYEFINRNQDIFIKNLFRKKPAYIKQFYKLLKKERKQQYNVDEFFSEPSIQVIPQINNIRERINNYSHIIETESFKSKIKKCEFNSMESLEDEIENIIYIHDIYKFTHSLFSNKNRHIINEESLNIVKSFFDNHISKNIIREGVGKKIASIKTSEEFNDILKKERNNFFEWGENFIKAKIDSLNVEIVYNENNKFILEVKDFESSKIIGSPSWCISRSERFFKNYTHKANSTQYFLYDFNLSPEDSESLVGITTENNEDNKGFKVIHAHDKNDKNILKSNSVQSFLNNKTLEQYQHNKFKPIVKKFKKMAH